MKTILNLCMVLSIAAVTNGMNPFGGLMDQAKGAFQQFAGMIPGADKIPFKDMMNQFGPMTDNPEQLMNMMQEHMGQMTQQGQKAMMPFMEKMMALKDQGASPEQFMTLMNEMKKAVGQ